MRAADTNVLVRLIARDDPAQIDAAETFISKGVWVSLVVLTEAVWVLQRAYQKTPQELMTIVEMLLAHEHITVQDADAVTSALRVFGRKPALGFSDCLIVEIARKAGHLPLGTFDRNLGKLDGAERL